MRALYGDGLHLPRSGEEGLSRASSAPLPCFSLLLIQNLLWRRKNPQLLLLPPELHFPSGLEQSPAHRGGKQWPGGGGLEGAGRARRYPACGWPEITGSWVPSSRKKVGRRGEPSGPRDDAGRGRGGAPSSQGETKRPGRGPAARGRGLEKASAVPN